MVIDVLLGLAPLAIVPLALRLVELEVPAARRLRRLTVLAQPAAAALVVVALGVRPGLLSGALAAVWLAACLPAGLGGLLEVLLGPRRAATVVGGAGLGFLVVGASWLVISRLGLRPLGFSAAIVELTAVHFHYTGLAALTLAQQVILAAPRATGRRTVAAVAGLALVVGSPVTAAGFTLSSTFLQVIGVGLVATSVMALAAATMWLIGGVAGPGWGRGLLRISAMSVFLPMPLAIDYTLARAVRIPTLDIPAMALVHGTANAVLFCGCGLVGWLVMRRRGGGRWPASR